MSLFLRIWTTNISTYYTIYIQTTIVFHFSKDEGIHTTLGPYLSLKTDEIY